jgi:hypothetical protein
MMFPGLHPMAMMSTSNMSYTSRGSAGFPGGMYGAGPAPYPSMYQSSVPAAQSSGAQGGDTQVHVRFCNICFMLKIICLWDRLLQNIHSASHSRVAPVNVGLQKERKCNTFACHTCNEVRLCVLGIRKREVGNMKR